MSTELPKHIGGFQHLSPEVATLPDDLMVLDGKPLGFVGTWAPLAAGELSRINDCNVYRKIPVPRQGGERAAFIPVDIPTRTEAELGAIARAVQMSALPSDHKARKAIPLATGVLDYFPDALIAVAELSRIGNDQHNPGQPLHWDRSKSGDEADALMRHLVERDAVDSDGVLHAVKVAWRGLALAQKRIEAGRAKK